MSIVLNKKGEGHCPNGTCSIVEKRNIVFRRNKLECQICKREYNKDTWTDVIWTEEGFTPPIEYL